MFDLAYVPIHIVACVLIHLYTFNQLYWMTKKRTPPRPKKLQRTLLPCANPEDDPTYQENVQVGTSNISDVLKEPGDLWL